jgi:hypothetical protein
MIYAHVYVIVKLMYFRFPGREDAKLKFRFLKVFVVFICKAACTGL